MEVLPISAAGVSLLAEGRAPQYIAASDSDALRFEQLQTDIDEGPCLAAYLSGEAVAVTDLAHDERFLRFGPAAVAAGLAAVFSFPLRSNGGRFGALDLYRGTPGLLDPEDMEAAQTLADVAAAYLLNARSREEASSTTERLRHSSLHDPLTGLPNRLLLKQRLEHAALRARRSHSYAVILFADLDRFKRVNDTYGHHVGDLLLLAVAQRLSHLVRPGDTLCRYAGDEFVFLCEDLVGEADAELLASRVDEAFADPFLIDQLAIRVSASVGMAFAGPGEDVTDDLVAQADTAMYQAKRKGGAAHQVIDLRETTAADERHQLESDLRLAFAREQLEVHYQPIVRSADGSITGAEALLRWNDPSRGPVDPALIISLAEETDLITDLGAWILDRACRDHASWPRSADGRRWDLAVNVSARQLMVPNFFSVVASVLGRTGMDPASLVLEMTEYILIGDLNRAMTVLDDVKTLGVRIALDDFGTGYSSLSYLRQLPIDIVKIDQCFISDIGRASTGEAMVSAVTNLAHVVGLTVIAEGVETMEQSEAVRSIGCELSQGYFFARPMASGDLAELLAGA